MTPSIDIESLRERLLRGDRAALARAITLAESKRADHRALASDLIDSVLPETGKAIRTECRPEIATAADILAMFGGLATELKGETLPFSPDMLALTTREPLGVVAAILPWNVPLVLMALKIGPALVAGNTVVVKASEE
ncbi:aldehyde dehydrogenase family protein, partial [Citrobacter sp. VF227]